MAVSVTIKNKQAMVKIRHKTMQKEDKIKTNGLANLCIFEFISSD